MSSMEKISIHIHPACEPVVTGSSSLDTLCPAPPGGGGPCGGASRSYSDAAIHRSSSSSSSSSSSAGAGGGHGGLRHGGLRHEVGHVCAQLKQKGAQLCQRLTSRSKRGRGSKRGHGAGTSITVEYMGGHGGCEDDQDDEDEDGDTLELPDHNYSPALQLTELRDGCFSAELPLDALPTGQITIRIRNYKMEVIVLRRSASVLDDKHCITCPLRYGDIDIPIYVNPATLSFEVDNEGKKLYVQGVTKGCSGRSLSIPGTHYDLDSFRHGRNQVVRSQSCHRSPARNQSPRRSLTVSHKPAAESFRRRARTH